MTTRAVVWSEASYIIRGEGEGYKNYDIAFDVALKEGNDPIDPIATRETFTLVGSNFVTRVDVVTIMYTDRDKPTRCTFSGTAELIRAR